ncbi:hypothetical protein GC176_14435 [bacterium]|nr:hypothetical protein [bacterium]
MQLPPVSPRPTAGMQQVCEWELVGTFNTVERARRLLNELVENGREGYLTLIGGLSVVARRKCEQTLAAPAVEELASLLCVASVPNAGNQSLEVNAPPVLHRGLPAAQLAPHDSLAATGNQTLRQTRICHESSDRPVVDFEPEERLKRNGSGQSNGQSAAPQRCADVEHRCARLLATEEVTSPGSG